MKLSKTALKPNFRTFLGLFILSMISLLIVRTIFYLTTNHNSFDLSTAEGWLNVVGYPLFISLGVTFGTRRLQLVIYDTVDLESIKSSTVEYFKNNGLKIKKEKKDELEFESNNQFNRLFNNWFGTELTTVRQTDNKIIIEGPFRHVDSIDSKLRSSKRLG
ncbi:MAG: hypothetical protein ABIK73_08945 [candidate division WOR-3 bacterium]